ncbi:large subunit ribosomal protein L23 [Marchantia polymorpha subsp. ruderalis]|uniref:Large ribosomal subunit protein uL23m n=2 Tax=Marchantia polymorpha TaxID=3197 RepID=A0A176WRU2_MARPO|nr:hypothetical protein AXG93_1864s1340 [Marchantia polymorpha subsp. ruderalis]PTQ36224.1 hypothetical protein MARPO_0065s0037 [Marchantia polymorpha]BBM99732.1 hypothetical protein Mp_1g23410 [Marchantia polymorpha subsp. ruderalis]|eukprot:PTQ36224.1 hypothetical protein MARPO_0065s0037 [Marchantia polymorpha]
MASVAKKLGRVIHFANLPLKLLMPNQRENIKEVAFKTVPSASKIEIRRVLESVYGLEVEKVNTLNMEGKKKLNRKTGKYYRRPDYKKAYVVLKNPVTLPADVFPLNAVDFEDSPEKPQAAKK